MKNYKEMAESVFIRRDEYIEGKRLRMKRARKVTELAMCVCLVVISGVGAWHFGIFNTSNLPLTSNEGQESNDNSVISVPNNTESSLSDNNGIYIDKFNLPSDNASGAAADMLGLVVYNGNIYTQAEYIRCNSEQKQAFIGNHLGTAIGNIDEWSRQSEYSTEFASTVTGEVYSVNGYDRSFRICISEMYDGCEFIAFFENLNGISLTTGEDLYGSSRLSLKGNYSSVLYQTHDNWNKGVNQYKNLNVSDDVVSKFIDALYSSPFVDLSNNDVDIYNSDTVQTHLCFKMNDGTTVEIRLFKNGYVGYQNMYGRVFVKMSNEVFSTVFNAASD